MDAANTSYAEIEDAVLHLPLLERSLLAARLIESLEDDIPPVSKEWWEAISHRVRRIDEGQAELIAAPEVWRRVNERFGTTF